MRCQTSEVISWAGSQAFRWVLVGSAWVVFGAGCRADSASRPTATVRDSAGVTIVENRGAVAPDGGGWALAQEPRLSIGSVDGPEAAQLYRVRGAVRLPDCRIAVANEGSQEIKTFGADGKLLKRLGGKGEGPGEFNAVILAGGSATPSWCWTVDCAGFRWSIPMRDSSGRSCSRKTWPTTLLGGGSFRAGSC